MGLYILKRILIILPTLFGMMVIAFFISRSAPGDPVILDMAAIEAQGRLMSREIIDREYLRTSQRLGLDRPIFYFALSSQAYPDSLYRILRLSERESLSELINTYGNWPEISDYYHTVCKWEEKSLDWAYDGSQMDDVFQARLALTELRSSPTRQEIDYRLDLLDTLAKVQAAVLPELSAAAAEIRGQFQRVESNATVWKNYIPSFKVYGMNNQFNHWLISMLSLDFGKSYRDKMLVSTKIKNALPWTVFLGFFSFVIAYLIAIPVGVYSVRHRNSWQDQSLTTGLFLLYSVPTFVAGMLLMTLLCNPDYLYLFPTSGIASDGAETWGFWARMKDHAYHLFLPTLVYSYGSIAFLSRQMRVGMLDNVNMDYIRTARAKGLSERVVIWKHALRNSILPLVTHFASLLPRLVSGAVITESIFSIPGMGRLTLLASFSYDHPTLIAILTLGGFLTLLGILLSDILYALVDPRITFAKR